MEEGRRLEKILEVRADFKGLERANKGE